LNTTTPRIEDVSGRADELAKTFAGSERRLQQRINEFDGGLEAATAKLSDLEENTARLDERRSAADQENDELSKGIKEQRERLATVGRRG